MMAVAVVVSEHSAVVHAGDFQVYIGQTIGDQLSVLVPCLLFEDRALSPTLEAVDGRVGAFLNPAFSRHIPMLQQNRRDMSGLLPGAGAKTPLFAVTIKNVN
jgi:hypothetical protein